jgi:hypothetical protein
MNQNGDYRRPGRSPGRRLPANSQQSYKLGMLAEPPVRIELTTARLQGGSGPSERVHASPVIGCDVQKYVHVSPHQSGQVVWSCDTLVTPTPITTT